MLFTGGGDVEHYTVGANAAFLLLLVHVLTFTILLGLMLAIVISSLHMFGQLLPVTERLLHSSRRYCALQFLISASGDQPVCCGTFGDKQPFFSDLGVHTIFYTASLGIVLPF